MPVELLLFDLDDTLLCTHDLEHFRGQAFVGRQPQGYVDGLVAEYRRIPERINYSRQLLESFRAQGLRLGVFTKAPRHYSEILIGMAYPGLSWDVLIAYEDVVRTKPRGEGILSAMAVLGVASCQNVWMVGDNVVDIRAAYDAGCRVVLDQTTWPNPRRREDWWALERMPDAIIRSPQELSQVLASFAEYLPAAEQLQASNEVNGLRGDLRFEKVNFFDDLERRPYVPIHFLGRHFSREAYRRADWHQVTQDIHRMKDVLVAPEYWIDAIRAFLRDLIQRHPMLIFSNSLVVTVIPAKPERVRRLEAMLNQLEQSHIALSISRAGIQFLPDLMRYLPGVLSQHAGEGLNKRQRFENVRDYLRVIEGSGYAGKHVVVIDDVGTTGASLVYAQKYLMEAGAQQVTCLALTKAVSIQ